MFRVVSLCLALVGIGLFHFGWTMCGQLFNCSDVAMASRGVIKPREVQFIMLFTAVIGMFSAFIGVIRGPSTFIPGRLRGPGGRPTDDPLSVRGFLLFGAAAVLIGMVIPLQGLATPIPEGETIAFYGTVLASMAVLAYFGWHLGATHDG